MSDEYGAKIDSRCRNCGNWATEGQSHTCPTTGRTETHTNPHAPKEEK